MSIVDRARELRKQIEVNASTMTDTDALLYTELYPNWSGGGVSYTVGGRVRYGGKLYKVLQDHTSQEYWTPEDAPSLFAEVLTAEDGTILEWVQPDSTNPYMTGDKVTHNNKTWASTIDNNVWEPGVYGWVEVV